MGLAHETTLPPCCRRQRSPPEPTRTPPHKMGSHWPSSGGTTVPPIQGENRWVRTHNPEKQEVLASIHTISNGYPTGSTSHGMAQDHPHPAHPTYPTESSRKWRPAYNGPSPTHSGPQTTTRNDTTSDPHDPSETPRADLTPTAVPRTTPRRALHFPTPPPRPRRSTRPKRRPVKLDL